MASRGTCLKWLCLLLTVGIVIMSIALIATSLRGLESDEVGVMYNEHLNILGSETYTAGLHTGVPGYIFIKFPSVFKSLEFDSVLCLDNEGVYIKLTIQLQYRARPKHLRTIIQQYKDYDNYVKILSNLAETSIFDACSHFNTSQFQTQRGVFQSNLLSMMSARFGNVSADITDLQVSNIVRPKTYEDVIRSKEAAKENIDIALSERPRQLVQANTIKQEAITQSETTIQKALSNARVIFSKAEAEASVITAAYEAEAEAFLNQMQAQKLSVEGLLSYLGVSAIAQNNNTVNVGLDAPARTKYTYT